MTWLLADIGGTNTRLAFASPDGGINPVRVRNSDYASFDDALDAHRPKGDKISAACIAIAGPVDAEGGRLTNINWVVSRTALSARLDAPVTVINDLGALAASISDLPSGALDPLTAASVDPSKPITVLGFGTGVNISSAQPDGRGHPVLWSSEIGHATLPTSVANIMDTPPASIEEAFSGRGIANVIGAPTGAAATTAPEYSAARSQWAKAAGTFLQELAWITKPTGGLVLAGSVLRAILQSDARDVFVDACAPTPRAGIDLRPIPCALITLDEAGLFGCRTILKGALA
ncbi:MAG: glucokinase [Pseudomonadota bacterium]